MRVRTRPFADRLERENEALVLLVEGAGLVRLSAMGAAIVDLALNGIHLDALARCPGESVRRATAGLGA